MIEVKRRLVRRAGQIFPVREVEFVREGATLATLVEGDPLLRALDMPLEDVERLRSVYAPAISSRPLVRAAFDVILEYKREQTDEDEEQSRDRDRDGEAALEPRPQHQRRHRRR